MCCFALLFVFLGPRFGILAMWIFGNRVDHAFDSWAWPLLGLFIAPWTTFLYLLAWSPVGGVSGGEWILVGLGVALDIGTYIAKPVQGRFTAQPM